MPFKNRKSFLAESVASALNSEHVNLELILVDDGSDDGSSEIAQEFSERNENVVYFRVPNSLGAYVSRNIGMMAASGDYIAFLDSDDIHDPLRLIKQIRVLQKNPGIRLTLTGANRFFQNFNGAPTYRVLFASISMVFHSSLIKEQGYFDSVRFGGDSEYLFRVLRNFPAPAIALLRASLYSIRLSEGSLTTSGAGSYYPDGNLNNRQSLSKSRQQYVAAYKDAHKLKGFFFVPFYQTERLIPFGDSENIVIVPELGELLPRNEISSEGSRVTSGVCAPKPNHKDLHGAEE
jgi:glycosyltransferase involved in cell wall biosynthesis